MGLIVSISKDQSEATVKNGFFLIIKETVELISGSSRVAGHTVNIQQQFSKIAAMNK